MFAKDINVPDKNVVKSNADRIRAMSDKELAKAIEMLYTKKYQCPDEYRETEYCTREMSCLDCWLDWLKSPVEGTE